VDKPRLANTIGTQEGVITLLVEFLWSQAGTGKLQIRRSGRAQLRLAVYDRYDAAD